MAKVKETTYTGILGDWQRSLNTFAANAADLSHLETSRVKLEGIFQKAQDVATQQAALTASRQELSQQMKKLVLDGQRVMLVLRVSLKDHYGPRSEKLAEFGLQPFRGRNRKSKPGPQTEPEPAIETPGPVIPTSDR